MKTIQRIIVLAALITGTASVAFAGPGSTYWETLRKESQFKDLKAGDKIVYVCNQCKTITEKTIESTAEAMDLCKDGAVMSCPSCKTQVKVVRKAGRNDAPTHTDVAYLNEKGEECMFIAKVADKK